LSDRRGRKPFIVLGLALQAATAVGFIVAASPWPMFFVRVLQGVGGAMIMPITMALVGEISPPGEESRYTGHISVAMFAGFGVGPLAGGLVNDHFSFAGNFLLLGGLSLAACVGVAWFLPKTAGSAARQARVEIPYRILMRNTALRGMFLFQTANAFGRGLLAALLPLFAVHRVGLSATLVGIVLSVNILTTAAFQPLFGRIADHWSRRGMIVIGSGVFAAALLVSPLVESFATMLVVGVVMGLAGAMALPAASGIVAAEGKHGAMGGSMAIFNIGMSLGLAVGPMAGGYAKDLAGFSAAFVLAAVSVAAGMAPVFWMGRSCEGAGCSEAAELA
jgi:MFS family permease